jgi:REP element-mobilizing transposase RayT
MRKKPCKTNLAPLLQFFDPDEPVSNMSGNLPHWRQEGTMYFVTFRLADSMPQEKLNQWIQERELWHKTHRAPYDKRAKQEYARLFPERFQKWLDAGYGECILDRREVKSLVENALNHFDGLRYDLDEFCIMPNHVHVLVVPLESYELSEILHSWKSYTSHEINKILKRKGIVWQKESFDHIVRNAEQLEKFRRYIQENPRGETPRLL